MNTKKNIKYGVLYETQEKISKAINLGNQILHLFDAEQLDNNIITYTGNNYYKCVTWADNAIIDMQLSDEGLKPQTAEYTKKRQELIYTAPNSNGYVIIQVHENFDYDKHRDTMIKETTLLRRYVYITNILDLVLVGEEQFSDIHMKEMNHVNKYVTKLKQKYFGVSI